MPAERSAEVAASRFPGWVTRFAAGHGGGVRLDSDSGRPVVHAADGASAQLDVAFDPGLPWSDLDALLGHIASAARTQPYLLLLLRRGGWAVGRCAGERVTVGRVGTRYVQGRTKKGGSSQQRYARRRGNQADSVVSAAVSAAHSVWALPASDGPWQLVTGGDRLLIGGALALLGDRPPLLPTARTLDVPDPRRTVLDAAAVAACAVRVRVQDSPDGPDTGRSQ
jgi:hypothetical protein